MNSLAKHVFLLLTILAFALLVACGRHSEGPDVPGATNIEEPATKGFALASVAVESFEGRPAAVLTFSKPLAGLQNFDDLVKVSGENKQPIAGSWALVADSTQLRFPYLEANKKFLVAIKPGLASAKGQQIAQALEREIYTGPLEPQLGFVSQGSVLPAHETRGLPIISVNVSEVDVEFLKVKEASVAAFLSRYQRSGGRKSTWDLTEIGKLTDSVYANRFSLDFKPNERTITYLPVRDVSELKAPGIYFAVMKRPAQFSYDYDTAMFFVSDLGLHVRAYGDALLVHAASLQHGKPVSGAKITLLNETGGEILAEETDGEGFAKLAAHADQKQIVVARRGDDITFMPFNQPALDLSEFAIAGHKQRALEIFPWASRDLYRPGETLRISALLRDFDGHAVATQPLFVTLKQPDGRVAAQAQLSGADLGYYEFDKAIPVDAPTGRWTAYFSTDPGAKDGDQLFSFRVEEFLPERLKLELIAGKPMLAPKESLPLTINAAYLYGAPAGGNRVTAKALLENADHPLDSLKDFYFGDTSNTLPNSTDNLVDEVLDENGVLETELPLLADVEIKQPIAVTVVGSVYETGGRAVSRQVKAQIWPAGTLVGVKPLFDMVDGATPGAATRFEIVRTDREGKLLPAAGLDLKLIREEREYNWRYVQDVGWETNYAMRYSTLTEEKLALESGKRGKFQFPLDWGSYRLEIADPETGLVTRLAFRVGWGYEQDRGLEAKPDKVKIVLDKTGYRAGDKLKMTITPPHEGPGIVLLETDGLVWRKNLDIKAGTVVEVPFDKAWERHDLYATAIVFRPGSSRDTITPNRAVGISHIPVARAEREVEVSLASPDKMRPQRAMKVQIKAPALAGQTAQVRINAVDLGVLNITQFPLPNANDWFFAQRGLGVEAYDIYNRVIESLHGEKARLRFGGDMALAALPNARRPNADIQTVDLFHAPVALDGKGEAAIDLQVPDFNGTLRVRALVFSADHFGSAEHDSIVQAPLVVEASTPRVMADGDRSQVTVDLHNLSGKPQEISVQVKTDGPVVVEQAREKLTLADQAKRTLTVPLRAKGSFGVGEIHIDVQGAQDISIERHFRLVVRPAWPAVTRAVSEVQTKPETIVPDAALLAGLVPDSVNARLTVSTLPPLPFATSAKELLEYPYGCVEQTSSKAYPLIWLDQTLTERLNLGELSVTDPMSGAKIIVTPEARARMLEHAFARLTSMQVENGHFAMWPGDTYPVTYMTPYVVELFLNAREAGFAVPEAVLKKALDRINEDLLAGGNAHYDYEYTEHLRLAEMAYGGYVLSRVKRAPIGTLRAIVDNQAGQFKTPLPLIHLGIALKLMGDGERADKAIKAAFSKHWERPDYLGDYGSPLRDTALMLALLHEQKMSKPEYDVYAVGAASELLGREGKPDEGQNYWLSTQEHSAVLRLGRALLNDAPRSFGASVKIGGVSDEMTGKAVLSRVFSPEQLSKGASITPFEGAPLYVIKEAAGVPLKPMITERKDLRIKRRYYAPDGQDWEGGELREGELLVVGLEIDSNQNMKDALVVDLVPGGLELENLNLTDASQWEDIEINGVRLAERASAAEIRFEEYRDDRYVAAIRLYSGSKAHLFYLVRAVSPGHFVVPAPSIEDMYRPSLRAVGEPVPAHVDVRSVSAAAKE